jgi:hypothetical protein
MPSYYSLVVQILEPLFATLQCLHALGSRLHTRLSPLLSTKVCFTPDTSTHTLLHPRKRLHEDNTTAKSPSPRNRPTRYRLHISPRYAAFVRSSQHSTVASQEPWLTPSTRTRSRARSSDRSRANQATSTAQSTPPATSAEASSSALTRQL